MLCNSAIELVELQYERDGINRVLYICKVQSWMSTPEMDTTISNRALHECTQTIFTRDAFSEV